MLMKSITEEDIQKAEDAARKLKFGVSKRTIDELFRPIIIARPATDITVVLLRDRIMQLADILHDMLYEKSVSIEAHGRRQVQLWNNLIDATKIQLHAYEMVHQSLCNEANVTRYVK